MQFFWLAASVAAAACGVAAVLLDMPEWATLFFVLAFQFEKWANFTQSAADL